MKISKKTILTLIMMTGIIMTMTSCVRQTKPNQGPCSVTNIYPAQSELVDENYFYAKWTEGRDPEGGAVRYKINYAQTLNGLEDPQFYETAETWFLFPNLKEGAWFWQVTTIDNAGNKTPSPIWTFTVNGETLPQPVNPEDIPTDPALIVSEVENTSFTLDWPAYEDRQNPSQAVEYIIYVYDQGPAASVRTLEETGQWMSRIAPATTARTMDTIHTFNNMNSETLYDWVIVAQNNASQTSVVGSSQVKTGNRTPLQPTLLEPTEGATEVATDVTLSWSASSDPDEDEFKYYVYMDIVKNTNRNITVEGIDRTSYQPEGLEEGRTYYWFIMVKDTNGAATRTAIQTFMTKSDGMNVPKNPTPADETTGIDAKNPPLLQWEHDKNNRQITYSVYLSKNPKSITKVADGLDNMQYQIPEILAGETKYYWAIEAKDVETGKTTRSGVWTFQTGTIAAPVQTAAVTNSEGTQIELTYDKAMIDPTGKKNSYTVKIKKEDTNDQIITTGKIEMKPGTTNVYVLTLEAILSYGDRIFMDYTPGTIAATDGGKLVEYTDFPVTNMIPGEAPLVSAATATANSVEIAFDKDMKEPPADAKTQFSIQSGNVSKQIISVTRGADNIYILNLAAGQAINYGETIMITYTKGTVQAENRAYLESFTGIIAVNNVAAPKPLFVSGETTEDGRIIKVTFDKAMTDPTGKHDQFTPNISGSPAIGSRTSFFFTKAALSTDDARTLELTLNSAVSNGQIITIDYTAGDVSSTDGATLADFINKPVTNNVPATIPICTAAAMKADGRSVEMTFSGNMRVPTIEESHQFGVLVGGYVNEIKDATLSPDRRVITLNLSKPIGKNNDVHVSYTKGTVSTVNGGLLESFVNMPVDTDALTTIWVIKGIRWNYSSIRDAIDGAADDDVIMVATGTYVEAFDFDGKAITLKSTYETDPEAIDTTIIDAQNKGPVMIFRTREDRDTVFEGFTVINGQGVPAEPTSSSRMFAPYGGAVTIAGASPTIKHNIFKNNISSNGGAINISDGNPLITDNEFISNSADRGGAIYLKSAEYDSTERRPMNSSTATIYANTIKNNSADSGGGIYVDSDSYTVLNADNKPWRPFNSPAGAVSAVEHNSDASKNNAYSGNGTDNGDDIYFNGESQTPLGTFIFSNTTITSNGGIAKPITATYTPAEYLLNGSITFDIPASITLDKVYVTANGIKSVFEGSVVEQAGSSLTITGLNGAQPVIFEIIPKAYIYESNSDSDYTFKIKADADGDGSNYTASELQEKCLKAENKLSSTGAQNTTYGIVNNGDGFWTYTVKIFTNRLDSTLQNINTWELELGGATYTFRTNTFNTDILQCDNIPTDTGITEQMIKDARFEPRKDD